MRAETCANDILSGKYWGVEPRIQTFYPIIAGWTYSGCDEGPQKVMEWIDRLEEVQPKLEPRLSFHNAPIMARISLQRQILNRTIDTADPKPSRMENRILESAIECRQLLETTIGQQTSSPNYPVRHDLFVLGINAWYNAASAAISNENLEEARRCVREIQTIVDLFDDVLVRLNRVDNTDHGKRKFLELLDCAPAVYGAQLRALTAVERNIGTLKTDVAKDYDSTMHLISIEEKIQRFEEFHLLLEQHRDLMEEGTLKGKIYSDVMSVFELMGGSHCKSWPEYIESSLDILEKAASDSSIGEPGFVRLCTSIARATSGAAPAVLNSLAKDRITEKVVGLLETYCRQNHDRGIVISKAIESLKKPSVSSPGGRTTGGWHPSESKDRRRGADKDEGPGTIHAGASTKRKARRKRSNNGNDPHRSSYARSKVLNPAFRRRHRSHHAKSNE